MKLLFPLLNSSYMNDAGWIAASYYIKNLLNAITFLKAEDIPEHIILIPENAKMEFILPEFKKNSSWITWKYVPEELLFVTRIVELDNFINEIDYDVFINLNNLPEFRINGASISWIPDFQHKRLPIYFSKKEIEERDINFGIQALGSDVVLLSSQDSVKDFNEFFPLAKDKASLYRFASILAKSYFEMDPLVTLNKFNISQEFIYLPNQFWKHKNHMLVYRAWKLIQEKGYSIALVTTGAATDYRFPEYREELNTFYSENGLEKSILNLGFITREEQIQLYRCATFLLQPSLFEGWSTSIEDAKAIGLPVIASDFSVHPEQVVDGIFFKSDSPEDLAEKIISSWENRKKNPPRQLNESYVANIKMAAESYLEAVKKAYTIYYERKKNSYTDEYLNLLRKKNLTELQNLKSQLFLHSANSYVCPRLENGELVLNKKIHSGFMNLRNEDFEISFGLPFAEINFSQIAWQPMQDVYCRIKIDSIFLFVTNGQKNEVPISSISHTGYLVDDDWIEFISLNGFCYIPVSKNSPVNKITIRGKWKAFDHWQLSERISSKLQEKELEIQRVRNSLSFKLGNLIVSPIAKLRKLI